MRTPAHALFEFNMALCKYTIPVQHAPRIARGLGKKV